MAPRLLENMCTPSIKRKLHYFRNTIQRMKCKVQEVLDSVYGDVEPAVLNTFQQSFGRQRVKNQTKNKETLIHVHKEEMGGRPNENKML